MDRDAHPKDVLWTASPWIRSTFAEYADQVVACCSTRDTGIDGALRLVSLEAAETVSKRNCNTLVGAEFLYDKEENTLALTGTAAFLESYDRVPLHLMSAEQLQAEHGFPA